MPAELAPKLKKITVKYDRLVLDPNNPRFITRKQDQIPEELYLDQDTCGATKSKMQPEDKKDPYKIGELVSSIKQNGWIPVDSIFVRKLQGEHNRYVVLEGNRRVAAIREIMNDPHSVPDLKKNLESIEVMEVLDSGSSEELQKKIAYLLGVRHHGSLKRWTPYAQAHNIFGRYLEVSGQTTETFQWSKEFGQKVADTLSIESDEVRERLKVYRSMVQIGSCPEVKNSNGGMKDRYYSICAEPLLSPRTKLGGYISQDSDTFLLNDESVNRMNNLCHFHLPDREGAPLHNPTEWGYLNKILADEDQEKRETNQHKVEEEKKHPSEVWASRAKELARLTWEKWLLEVNSILKTVTLNELTETKDAIPMVKRLLKVIDQLDKQDVHQEAKHGQ